MEKSLIDRYGIAFTDKLPGWKGNKMPITGYAYITDFLFDWTLTELNEYLLPNINAVLNSELPELETGSETITIIVDPVSTTFYVDRLETDFPYIPTVDFRDIVLGWRDFLSK